VFLVGIGATAFLTLLIPVLTKAGVGFLIAIRVLQGLFEVRSFYILIHGNVTFYACRE
jgi:ACS family sodium-dependent inorganic phosphate cotransporter